MGNLTGQKTSKTFQNLMQISSSGQVFDGLGNLVTSLQLTASYLSGYVSSFPYTGSALITGSLGLIGSLNVTQGITSSLFGTSSWAVSASNATTASFLNSTTNAFIQNGNSFGTTAILGTKDNQSLALQTNSTTGMFISSSGNVGIGTTSPTNGTLEVNGNVYATSFTGSLSGSSLQAISSSFSSTASYATIASFASTASLAPLYQLTSRTSSMLVPYTLNSQTSSMLVPYILTSSTSSMSVLSASYAQTASFASTASFLNPLIQNVLITGSLTAGLSGNISDSVIYGSTPNVLIGMNTGSTGGVLDLRNTSGSSTAGDRLGTIQFAATNPGGVAYVSSQIRATTTNGASTGNAGGGNIQILTSAAGNGQQLVERMRITSDGNTLITGSLIVSSSNATQFLVGSSSIFVSSSGFVGINTQTPVARFSAVDTTSASGSANAGSLLDLQQTWNTVGNPTSIKLNVTNTSSGLTSNLLDLQVGGTSVFSINKFGDIGNVNKIGSINSSKISVILNTISAGNSITIGSFFSNTTGISRGYLNTDSFVPSNGNSSYNAIEFSGIVNQTGGANGITRGLYINPTITSAYDYRAIESTSGSVFLTSTISGSAIAPLLNLTQTFNNLSTSATLATLTINDTSSLPTSCFMKFLSGSTTVLSISKSGVIQLGTSLSSPTILSSDPSSGNQLTPGQAIGLAHYLTTQTGYGFWFRNLTLTRTPTSGENGIIKLLETFNPTSGTATHNGITISNTINQTGGANGITRGLYINPILTAASDYRAIEVTSGKIVVTSTITTAGTVGAQTINKISGKVNAAIGSTSLIVTNNLVTTTSIVICQIGTNDATARIISSVESNGSFTINYVAPTAETVIKFFVIN